MNIFNREKQHIKTLSPNFVVTPLLYSLKNSISTFKSMPVNDHFTQTVKQMAQSITEKNYNKSQLQIKQQKLNELRTSKLQKRLELRKYIKSLYNFKSDLAFYQTLVYNYNQNNRYAASCLKNLYYILKNSFSTFNCIISKPILEITPNQIKIKLFYYNSNKKSNYKKYILKELKYLCINLSKILKVSIVLDLVELQSYHLDGQVLATSFSIITDKLGPNFLMTANKLFNKTTIINPAQINYSKVNAKNEIAFFTGINIRLAGRLSRQFIIPRKTVKISQRGSLARRYTDLLTVSKYTAKNKKGIFCYTITIGHRFN